MTALKTRLIWNEVIKGEEWHAGGLARFYKIVYRPAKKTGSPNDTHRTDFHSLYWMQAEGGLGAYISSAKSLDLLKDIAQEHFENRN